MATAAQARRMAVRRAGGLPLLQLLLLAMVLLLVLLALVSEAEAEAEVEVGAGAAAEAEAAPRHATQAAVVTIDRYAAFKELHRRADTLLLKLGSGGCAACAELAPAFGAAALRVRASAGVDAVLAQADADSEAGQRLAKSFGVATWPTMLLWRRGAWGPAHPEATLTLDAPLVPWTAESLAALVLGPQPSRGGVPPARAAEDDHSARRRGLDGDRAAVSAACGAEVPDGPIEVSVPAGL